MLACSRLGRVPCSLRPSRTVGAIPRVAVAVAPASRRHLAAQANKDDKSWSEIAQEAAAVAKDVVRKVKDTATSAVQSITRSSKPVAPQRQQQQQRGGPLYGRDDDRPLPVPVPGGLLGGLVGGLVNTAIKGLAKELEKTAAESRNATELAAERISSSYRIKQRLGEVTVGLPISQSVSSQNINGRVSKTVNLILPLYNLAGVPVANAQVTQVEGQMQQTCRIAVRMPEGDTVVLEDDEPGSSSSSRRSKVTSQAGEIIDAEFKDLK